MSKITVKVVNLLLLFQMMTKGWNQLSTDCVHASGINGYK